MCCVLRHLGDSTVIAPRVRLPVPCASMTRAFLLTGHHSKSQIQKLAVSCPAGVLVCMRNSAADMPHRCEISLLYDRNMLSKRVITVNTLCLNALLKHASRRRPRPTCGTTCSPLTCCAVLPAVPAAGQGCRLEATAAALTVPSHPRLLIRHPLNPPAHCWPKRGNANEGTRTRERNRGNAKVRTQANAAEQLKHPNRGTTQPPAGDPAAVTAGQAVCACMHLEHSQRTSTAEYVQPHGSSATILTGWLVTGRNPVHPHGPPRRWTQPSHRRRSHPAAATTNLSASNSRAAVRTSPSHGHC